MIAGVFGGIGHTLDSAKYFTYFISYYFLSFVQALLSILF